MLKMFDAIEGVRDPQRMAQKLADYANGKDKLFNDLKARVESGDKTAEFEMQQHMLNNELGERKCWCALACLPACACGSSCTCVC